MRRYVDEYCRSWKKPVDNTDGCSVVKQYQRASQLDLPKQDLSTEALARWFGKCHPPKSCQITENDANLRRKTSISDGSTRSSPHSHPPFGNGNRVLSRRRVLQTVAKAKAQYSPCKSTKER